MAGDPVWRAPGTGFGMKVPLLDLKAQYTPLRAAVRQAIDEVCDAQQFILGPAVTGFEEAVARYCGEGVHAVGVSSGTDALLAVLMAWGIGPGDAVLTTPYTFFATGGCVARLGATPVFADVDARTLNLDPAAVRRLLADWPPRFAGLTPKVLMPVHLYGQCADMDGLLAVAAEYGLKVVEDACQAIGAEYPSRGGARRAGTMGDAGCFSFFPSKNLGGFGDGGMIVTRDGALAERLRQLRNHGAHPKYYHAFIGGNFRLDALQAAVLSVKLPHLDGWHAARRANAARYAAALGREPAVTTPVAVYEGRGLAHPHIYNQYVVRVPGRDGVRQRLAEAGVGTEVYYPVPLHLQACFESLGYKAGDLPVSEAAARDTLALPVYPELSGEMIDYAADAVRRAAAAANCPG